MLIYTRHKISRILAAVAVLILYLLLPIEAQAAHSADVTVTAWPGGLWAPIGFTVTWLSDTEVKLEWTPPIEAVATHIRMKVGVAPQNVTDGYPVYTGAGTTINDVSSNLDEMAGIVYYSAWSVGGDDTFSTEHVEGSVEGAGMLAIANALTLFLALTFAGFLNWLALKYNSIFLYALMTPADITFGLYFASNSMQRFEWIFGVVLAVIGIFCLFRAVMMGLDLLKEKRRADY